MQFGVWQRSWQTQVTKQNEEARTDITVLSRPAIFTGTDVASLEVVTAAVVMTR